MQDTPSTCLYHRGHNTWQSYLLAPEHWYVTHPLCLVIIRLVARVCALGDALGGVGYSVTPYIHRFVVISLQFGAHVVVSIQYTGSSQGPGIYRRAPARPKDQVHPHTHPTRLVFRTPARPKDQVYSHTHSTRSLAFRSRFISRDTSPMSSPNHDSYNLV